MSPSIDEIAEILALGIQRLQARAASQNPHDIVLMARGRQVADAVRAIGVTEVTYYRWRNEYGGLKGDQAKRLKEVETENSRLRRAVSDLTLDQLILAEAAKGNF